MRKGSYRVPAYLLILLDIFGFLLLYTANDLQNKILLVGFGVLGLFIVTYTVIVLCRMGDKFLILIASMLMSIGILMICRINPEMGLKQVLWIGLGCTVFFLTYLVYYKIRFWDRMGVLYALGGIALFLFTLVAGKEVNGAKNWVNVGPLAFQPSEIIKILYVMFLACYYTKTDKKAFMGISSTAITGGLTYVFIVFLMLQRDWGTILVIFSIYIFVLYVYETHRWFLALNVLAVLAVGYVGYKYLYHIQVRVDAWLDPWKDISDKGYQITQSLFGIASGGFFGRGLGNGAPEYIPEVHTDFIFSAICEEMGVFGGAAVIILFFLLAYRCFKVTLQTTDPFNKAVAFGLSVMFALQTFIIIGGVVKFIPLTGITVPFVSYGGTSIVVSFASLGIIQAISALEERKGAEIGGE